MTPPILCVYYYPMTQTSIPATLPAYSVACENKGNHSLDHVSGYDVIVTNTVEGVVRVAVVQTFDYSAGGTYGAALDSMRPLREAALKGDTSYAYVGQKWACGCRQAGRVARTGGCLWVGEMNLSA